MIPIRSDIVLLGALNSKCVAGLTGLIPAHLYDDIFFSSRVLSLPMLFFDWCNFCTHFLQGSVATVVRDGIVDNSFVANFPKRSASEKI